MEKYDMCEPFNQAGGTEYDVQEGFGWTNGVT
jgi:alpha,alpha-trehalase